MICSITFLPLQFWYRREVVGSASSAAILRGQIFSDRDEWIDLRFGGRLRFTHIMVLHTRAKSLDGEGRHACKKFQWHQGCRAVQGERTAMFRQSAHWFLRVRRRPKSLDEGDLYFCLPSHWSGWANAIWFQVKTRSRSWATDSDLVGAIDFRGNTYGFLANKARQQFGIIETSDFITNRFIKLAEPKQSCFIGYCCSASQFHLFIH